MSARAPLEDRVRALEGRLAGLEDREALADLLARYAWALDTGDVESLVSLFTPDGVLIEETFETPDRHEGREAIRSFAGNYLNDPDFPGRQHWVGHVRLEIEGDRGTATSFVLVVKCKTPPHVLRFVGWYEDVVRRVAGAWLFESRHIRLWTGPVLARFPSPPTIVLPRDPDFAAVDRGGPE